MARVHGFRLPFHPLQLLSWILFVLIFVLFNGFVIPPLSKVVDFSTAYALAAVQWLLSILVLYCTIQTTRRNPLDVLCQQDAHSGQIINKAEYSNAFQHVSTKPPSKHQRAQMQKLSRRFDPNDGGETEQILFCQYCKHYVCLSSKHCRLCDKCISEFDHHCKWLNNCVGGANYSFFLGTVASVGGMLSYQFSCAAVLLAHSFTADNTNWMNELNSIYSDFFANLDAFKVFLIVFLVAHLLLLVLDLQLLALHAYLIWNNLTTYEWIMRSRSGKESSTGIQQLDNVPVHRAKSSTGVNIHSNQSEPFEKCDEKESRPTPTISAVFVASAHASQDAHTRPELRQSSTAVFPLSSTVSTQRIPSTASQITHAHGNEQKRAESVRVMEGSCDGVQQNLIEQTGSNRLESFTTNAHLAIRSNEQRYRNEHGIQPPLPGCVNHSLGVENSSLENGVEMGHTDAQSAAPPDTGGRCAVVHKHHTNLPPLIHGGRTVSAPLHSSSSVLVSPPCAVSPQSKGSTIEVKSLQLRSESSSALAVPHAVLKLPAFSSTSTLSYAGI